MHKLGMLSFMLFSAFYGIAKSHNLEEKHTFRHFRISMTIGQAYIPQAQSGVLVSDFHVAPNCAPTRAAMLSGMDNHLSGLGTMSEIITENQKGKPSYEGYLNFKVLSLPEILSQSGYNSAQS